MSWSLVQSFRRAMSGWYSGELYQAFREFNIGKFYHYDPLRFPMSPFWHFMGPAFCEVARAVLRHHRPNLGSVFLELAASVMMCSAIR
jgi:hypothetical protein